MTKPKIALVLGGGGIKPYSAIPLLKFLNSNQIDIDILVGCSGGAIGSAMIASGYSPEDMISFISSRVRKKIFRPDYKAIAAVAGLPFGRMDKERALIKPDSIRKLFRELFGSRRIEDPGIKTILQATDFQTGEGVGLEKGDLADCVYASSAIFPLLPAIKIEGRWLFDGVFSAPVPVLQAVRHKADMIIVMDFLEKLSPNPKGYYETTLHYGKIYAKTIAASQTCLTLNLTEGEVIYVKVVFDKYISIWDTEKLPVILEAGEIALEKVKGEILQFYRQYQQLTKSQIIVNGSSE